MILVIDTATRTGILGLATPGGELRAKASWASAHRHGEELLTRLDSLLASLDAKPADIFGIAVGTGPGSFTGLRIGLATAKTLAYGLGVPMVGVPTTLALALAAPTGTGRLVVALPAGANDRYVTVVQRRAGGVEEVAPPTLNASLKVQVSESALVALVAVDLVPPEVPDAAVELGRQAVEGLGAALARLGAAALAAGESADVAALVPAYVALPRGIAESAASMEWSPDLR